MKNLGYYLQRNPLAKGFIAKTVTVNTYTDKEFISEMHQEDNSISEQDIKDVMKLLVKTSAKILSMGNAIIIPNFLKISPSVKGTFETADESFDDKKHYVNVNCSVSQLFISDLQKLIKVEKVDKPINIPHVVMVKENKTKQDAIHKKYANQIVGDNFIMSGYQFDGIEITSKSDMNQFEFIQADNLDIINLKPKEIVFVIERDYQTPAWLTNDLEIYIKVRLISTKEESELYRESDFFETKWLS